MAVLLLLLLLTRRAHCEGLTLETGVGPCLVQLSDINLGFLLNIQSSENEGANTTWFNLAISEAARWAIRYVNHYDYLRNLKLGYVIIDHGMKERTALANALHFLPTEGTADQVNMTSCLNSFQHFQVKGLLTTGSSQQTVMTASVAGLTTLPVVATMASSDELSSLVRFDSLVRLVPPDRYQAKAIVDLLRYFNWTYVSLLYSTGSYGEYGAMFLERYASENSICLAYSQRISTRSHEDIVRAIVQRAVKHTANVVILYLDYDCGKKFFKIVKELNATTSKVWIASDALSYVDVGATKNGFMSVNFVFGNASEFFNYYNKMTPQDVSHNPWLKKYWEQKFQCSWNGEASCLKINTPPPLMPLTDTFIPKLIDSVLTYAHGFYAYLEDKCPEVLRRYTGISDKEDSFSSAVLNGILPRCLKDAELFPYLRNVSFDGFSGRISFNNMGDMLGRYVITQYAHDNRKRNVVALWDKTQPKIEVFMENMKWDIYDDILDEVSNKSTVVRSVCSKPCGSREYYRFKELICCWDCARCRDNEIIVNNRTACAPCPQYKWPDEETGMICDFITPTYLQWADNSAVALLCVSAIGAAATIVTATICFINRHSRLIKASSKELSAVILIGIGMAFSVIPLIVAPPTTWTCQSQKLGFDMSVCLIYAPLVVRTNRIHRIFAAGRKSNKRPPLISTRAQLLFVSCILTVQLIFCITVGVFAQPRATLRMRLNTVKFVERICLIPLEGFILPLVFNLLLVLSAAIYGFLTRKLPENFNESWYIFVSVSTTTFLWTVFLPTYFSSFYASTQATVLACCLILNAYISLFCLYIPKIYAIYFLEDNQYMVNNSVTKASISIQPSTTHHKTNVAISTTSNTFFY